MSFRFPIVAGFDAGAPTDVIADSLAVGDRWQICELSARRSSLEVSLTYSARSRRGLIAHWVGTSVQP